VNAALNIAAELRDIVRGKVLENEAMSEFTTMKVGGTADALFIPADQADLLAGISLSEKKGWPRRVIGFGSNVIVRDGGLEGLSVLLRGVIDEITVKGEVVRAGAGAPLPKLARTASKEGLAGLEWAAAIPGTLGGAIAGNAGAFGTSMADILAEARVLMPGGSIEKFENEKFAFSYRRSKLPIGAVILEAGLKLKKDDTPKIEKRMREMIEKRKATQPLSEPSAGSIFRNPPQAAAGKLIDSLGFKGKRRGGAMVSYIHANFIVNTGHASASDVIGLIDEIREKVRAAHGVELELEVQIIGREAAP